MFEGFAGGLCLGMSVGCVFYLLLPALGLLALFLLVAVCQRSG
jgi:hypothetical protein